MRGGRVAELELERPARFDLAEPGREHDRAAAAALPGLAHRRGTPGAGIATTTASTGSGRSARLGKHAPAKHLGAVRVDPPDRPAEPGALEVREYVAA